MNPKFNSFKTLSRPVFRKNVNRRKKIPKLRKFPWLAWPSLPPTYDNTGTFQKKLNLSSLFHWGPPLYTQLVWLRLKNILLGFVILNTEEKNKYLIKIKIQIIFSSENETLNKFITFLDYLALVALFSTFNFFKFNFEKLATNNSY